MGVGGNASAAMSKTLPIKNCQQSLLDAFQVAKCGFSWQFRVREVSRHRWLFDAHALEMPKNSGVLFCWLYHFRKNNNTPVCPSLFILCDPSALCYSNPTLAYWTQTVLLLGQKRIIWKRNSTTVIFWVWHVNITTVIVNCYIWSSWHVML